MVPRHFGERPPRLDQIFQRHLAMRDRVEVKQLYIVRRRFGNFGEPLHPSGEPGLRALRLPGAGRECPASGKFRGNARWVDHLKLFIGRLIGLTGNWGAKSYGASRLFVSIYEQYKNSNSVFDPA